MQIKGKTALVLGATRGIGKAIAESLAAAGANIVIPYYDWPQDSEKTKAHYTSLSGNHLVTKSDLRIPVDVEKLIKTIELQYGKLDILINNIERGGMPIVHGEYTQEQWDIEIDTTIKAKWLVFQAALPLMKKGDDGVVINISSLAGLIGRAGPAGPIYNDAYAAANRAISSFTQNWARQAAPSVRVNEICLGFFHTRHAEGTRGWDLLSSKQQGEIKNRTLLKRTGSLDEVVKAVLFLIEDATYMTGSVMLLDGGYSLGHDQVSPLPESQEDLTIHEV